RRTATLGIELDPDRTREERAEIDGRRERVDRRRPLVARHAGSGRSIERHRAVARRALIDSDEPDQHERVAREAPARGPERTRRKARLASRAAASAKTAA